MRVGSKLRRTGRIRGFVRSRCATVPPSVPRIRVVVGGITLQRGTLKPSSVAGSQLRTRDAARKLELYQAFCNIVGGVLAAPPDVAIKVPSDASARPLTRMPSKSVGVARGFTTFPVS